MNVCHIELYSKSASLRSVSPLIWQAMVIANGSLIGIWRAKAATSICTAVIVADNEEYILPQGGSTNFIANMRFCANAVWIADPRLGGRFWKSPFSARVWVFCCGLLGSARCCVRLGCAQFLSGNLTQLWIMSEIYPARDHTSVNAHFTQRHFATE